MSDKMIFLEHKDVTRAQTQYRTKTEAMRNCCDKCEWKISAHPLFRSQNLLFRELRELFNYATALVIMLSLYMFQFTMLFTIWCIYSDDIMTSGVAQLIW